jgi:hypothetical protein
VNQKILRVESEDFCSGQLETQRLHHRVAKLPGKTERRAAAAKQDGNHDTNDESLVAFFWGFRWGGNRHFIHDFFSLCNRLDKKTLFDE